MRGILRTSGHLSPAAGRGRHASLVPVLSTTRGPSRMHHLSGANFSGCQKARAGASPGRDRGAVRGGAHPTLTPADDGPGCRLHTAEVPTLGLGRWHTRRGSARGTQPAGRRRQLPACLTLCTSACRPGDWGQAWRDPLFLGPSWPAYGPGSQAGEEGSLPAGVSTELTSQFKFPKTVRNQTAEVQKEKASG